MAEARQRDEWNHTSSLLALLANCHRDPRKTRPYKPSQFHPHGRPQRRAPVAKAEIGLLKTVFVDRRI
jgi:hypothetical protein